MAQNPLLDDNEGAPAPSSAAPQGNPLLAEEAPAAPTQDNTDYGAMPWSEVAQRGAQNLIPSAKSAWTGLAHAVTNPRETLSSLGQIGQGLYSKAAGAMGAEQDPQEKASNEALVNALGEHYASTYGSVAGLKKGLATDPFNIGMDVASLVPAVGAGARAAGLTAEAGTMGARFAQAANIASKAIDPIQGPIAAATAAAKGIGSLAGKTIEGAQATGTGVPTTLLRAARAAGATTDPENKAAYFSFLKGNGDPRDIHAAAMAGLEELRQKASDAYLAGRNKIAASTTQLPLDKVQSALNDLNEFNNSGGNTTRFADAQPAIKSVNDQVLDAATSPHPNARTMLDLDNLKQSLQDTANAPGVRGTSFQGKIGAVARAVRDTIADHDPTYAQMMDGWQQWRQQLQDMQKGLGLNDKVAQSNAIGRIMRKAKTPEGQPLLDSLAGTSAGKTLPYMLAGSAISPWHAKGLTGAVEGIGGVGGLVAAATHPSVALPAAAAMAGSAPLWSPRIAGYMNYKAGQLAASPALRAAGKTISAATSEIPTTIGSRVGNQSLATNPPAAPSPQYKSPYFPAEEAPPLTVHRNPSRSAHAKGGKVVNGHQHLVDRLMKLAEKAKKFNDKKTEQILDVPDETVIKALDIAQKSI
jgi:hypothetical protein